MKTEQEDTAKLDVASYRKVEGERLSSNGCLAKKGQAAIDKTSSTAAAGYTI